MQVGRVAGSYCTALARGAGTFSHPKWQEEMEPVSTEKIGIFPPYSHAPCSQGVENNPVEVRK